MAFDNLNMYNRSRNWFERTVTGYNIRVYQTFFLFTDKMYLQYTYTPHA